MREISSISSYEKTYEDLRNGVFLQVNQFLNPELRFGEEIKIEVKKK